MLAIPACDRPRGALHYGCARLHGMVQVPGQEEIQGTTYHCGCALLQPWRALPIDSRRCSAPKFSSARMELSVKQIRLLTKVSRSEKFSLFEVHFSPKIVGDLNDSPWEAGQAAGRIRLASSRP